MKFRAMIVDSVYMRELLNIVTTFSRINKNLIINIQPTKVMIQIEAEVEAGQCLWCEIGVQGFFSEYVMDGIDTDYNQIYMVVLAANLVQALAYVRSNHVEYLKLKLSKTDMVCLSVEMSGTTHNDSDIICPKIKHDIPITVAPRTDWVNFNLPLDVAYDLTVLLPGIKSLKSLLDKKKNLSPSVTLYATLGGELSLVVETNLVTVASHYKGIQCSRAKPPDQSNVSRTSNNSSAGLEEASCKVDSKKLSILLESVNFFDLKMIANIKNEHLVNIKLVVRDNVFLNFILPAVDFE
ncbi:checkpoint protein HUS1 [Uranotaenia lowii]|uniref:checkpoint protein HUS1 n=1 Tax=Uranotaenia lowii TaxID=190385 RepID=UPI0024788009|nr:checkpoint protein HUS1 [Uranotaenia lowii]